MCIINQVELALLDVYIQSPDVVSFLLDIKAPILIFLEFVFLFSQMFVLIVQTSSFFFKFC